MTSKVFKQLVVATAATIAVALPLHAASAANLISNGGFATGDFTGWGLTTVYGSLGFPPDPQVTSFNVSGAGASNAAEFQVGWDRSGGSAGGADLSQSFTSAAGTLHFTADIAAYNTGLYNNTNAEGGIFTAILNGTTETGYDVGTIGPHQIIRDTLSFDAPVLAGLQSIDILIERPYDNGSAQYPQLTPFEYVTDVSASISAVPLPAALPMFAAALAGLGVVGRRRRIIG